MILLRQMRERRQYSQIELARRSGVSQQTISLIESGARPNPGIETMDSLATALECTIYDLYRSEQESEGEG